MISVKSQAMAASQVAALVALMVACASTEARSLSGGGANEAAGVIPAPTQEFGDELDIQRTGVAAHAPATSATKGAASWPLAALDAQEQAEPSNEAPVPVYASPFNRAQRGATIATPVAPASYEHRQESSHAPPNYAPSPAAPSASDDLKTSASYGHHHQGGHYGHDPSGWLDMGAWTGGKGSFGWYADYPVGGGKHHGYGRK